MKEQLQQLLDKGFTYSEARELMEKISLRSWIHSRMVLDDQHSTFFSQQVPVDKVVWTVTDDLGNDEDEKTIKQDFVDRRITGVGC